MVMTSLLGQDELAGLLGQQRPIDVQPMLGNPGFSSGFKLKQGLQGILGNPETRDLALSLLANSGYSPHKQSFGQIFGQSALQARQMGQQRDDDAFKRKYMETQMQAMGGRGQRKLISVLGDDGKPVLKYEDQAEGMSPYAGGNDAKPSALLQAFNTARDQGFTGTLLEFQRELAKASAQYPNSIGDVAGVPTLIPRINPSLPSKPQPAGMVQPTLTPQPLSSLPREAGAKQTLATAGAAGTTTGEKVATAAFDLPRVESNIDQAIGDLTKLREHKGLGYITGAFSVAPIVPGTSQASADALAKKVQGQTFLQAYNALKGAGAITETEGGKAEASIAALSRAQSTEDYQSALDDLKKVLVDGKARLRKQAGGTEDPLGIR